MISLGCCFTIPPNWSDSVKLDHRYRTGIQRAIWGNEKRAAYRSRYCLAESYSFLTLSLEESLWLRRKLYFYQAQAWGIPVWPDACQLSVDFESNDTVMVFDSTLYRHFSHCPYVVIISDYSTYEYLPVETEYVYDELAGIYVLVGKITKTTIDIVGIHQRWPAGSWVYPMFPALLPTKFSVKDMTASLMEGTLDVEELIEYFPGTNMGGVG
jgi:hypothetical protein